jgi:hypothetical protein
MAPLLFLQQEPPVSPVLASRFQLIDVIATVAARPVVRHKLEELIARQLFTKTTVFYAFCQAALDEMAVWLRRRDTTGAFPGIVGALAAPVAAERCGMSFKHH